MRRVMPLIMLISVLALLLLAAAGCGEENEGTQITMPTLSTTPASQATTTTSSAGPGISDIIGAVLQFADVASSNPYFKQIADLAAREIISGFADGTFRADSPVTRQQFAKMIVKTMGYPVSEADVCPFVDVPKGDNILEPFYPDNYVAVCAARGITEGKTPTEFAPNDNITRAQLITMVARAANLAEPPGDYSPPFDEFDDIHYPLARKAAHAELLTGLQGMGPGYDFFLPATRGEVAVLLYNLLHS